MNTTNITASLLLLASTAIAGCTADPSGATGSATANVDATDDGVRAVASSASIQLSMVELHDEIIVSEVAIPSADDIKPGFEVSLFAPTTLRPVAGLHGAEGLALGARDTAVFNFAPRAALAKTESGRQDFAFYMSTSSIDASELYGLATRYEPEAGASPLGRPGVIVTEAVCDFSQLTSEAAAPYPGLVSAGQLVDGTVHGAVGTIDAKGNVAVRLVAQVEHCRGPITSAAQAEAEPRLCYEKLVWLKANGKGSTELGRLSAYRAPLTSAQMAYCGD